MSPINVTATQESFINMAKMAEVKLVFKDRNKNVPNFWALMNLYGERYLAKVFVNPLHGLPSLMRNKFDCWGNQVRQEVHIKEDLTAAMNIGSKVELIETLLQLGVDQEFIKKFKTVKTSELKELVNDQDGLDKLESDQIVLRLTTKNDLIKVPVKVDIAKGLYTEVKVGVTQQPHTPNLNYHVTLDTRAAFEKSEEAFLDELAKLRIKVLLGAGC